jgi:hypothetical protein
MKNVAWVERSETRERHLSRACLRRITLRSIRATHLKDRAKIAFCESFPRSLIDFRFRSYRVSKPLRPDVSRQQSRCFNDLQGSRVPNSGTAFDNRRCFRLKEKIPLTKGRLPEASREVERVRFPRADLHSAPGRLRTPSGRHDDRPARSALDWDRWKTGNARQSRVLGSTAGAERWRSFAYARAAVERRQACALR